YGRALYRRDPYTRHVAACRPYTPGAAGRLTKKDCCPLRHGGANAGASQGKKPEKKAGLEIPAIWVLEAAHHFQAADLAPPGLLFRSGRRLFALPKENPMARSALLNVMVQAALKAGKSLSRDFGEVQNLQVSVKGPGDFVSQADRKAEKVIREDLL